MIHTHVVHTMKGILQFTVKKKKQDIQHYAQHIHIKLALVFKFSTPKPFLRSMKLHMMEMKSNTFSVTSRMALQNELKFVVLNTVFGKSHTMAISHYVLQRQYLKTG